MGPLDPRRRSLLQAAFAATLVPAAFAATPDRMRVVGWFSGQRQPPASVGKALAERGHVEGRTFRYEIRTYRDTGSRELSEGADELVATRPDAILAYWPFEITALLAATRSIPIVCGPIPDPVAAGFAQSLRRPGGNVTGLSTGSHEVWEIAIGMLRTLRPRLKRILVVHSPGMQVLVQMRSHREAARAAGLEWANAALASAGEAERALASLAGEAIHLAPIVDEGLHRAVLEIAHRNRTLTFGGDGCLMGYGRYFSSVGQRVAGVLDQVLRGADPAGIPFELPDRVRFALNRAVARRIGVEFPPDMVLRATHVTDS